MDIDKSVDMAPLTFDIDTRTCWKVWTNSQRYFEEHCLWNILYVEATDIWTLLTNGKDMYKMKCLLMTQSAMYKQNKKLFMLCVILFAYSLTLECVVWQHYLMLTPRDVLDVKMSRLVRSPQAPSVVYGCDDVFLLTFEPTKSD